MSDKCLIIKKAGLLSFILLSLLVGVCFVYGWGNGYFDTTASMRDYISSFGLLAPIILILLQAFQVVFPVIPGFLGCIVGTALFGATGGFLCNYLGISLGSLIAFLMARRYGLAFVKQILTEQKYHRSLGWISSKKSFIVVLWLSILLPLAPDDFLCYFSGLTDMPFAHFARIILLAKPWCILAYCLAFSQLF